MGGDQQRRVKQAPPIRFGEIFAYGLGEHRQAGHARRVLCSKKTRAYSVLRYKFPDGSPFQGVPANATGPGTFGGQNQPLPPANQTVSLTC